MVLIETETEYWVKVVLCPLDCGTPRIRLSEQPTLQQVDSTL